MQGRNLHDYVFPTYYLTSATYRILQIAEHGNE